MLHGLPSFASESVPMESKRQGESTWLPTQGRMLRPLPWEQLFGIPLYFSICSLLLPPPLPSSHSRDHLVLPDLASLPSPPTVSRCCLSVRHRLALSVVSLHQVIVEMRSCCVADSRGEAKPECCGGPSQGCLPRVCWKRAIIFLHGCPGK